jgi:PKD repeat protein
VTIPGPGQKITYLKFNLSTIPPLATITSAELELYLYQDISETATVSAYYCSNNNWDELLINWLNAPDYQSTPIYTRSSIAFEGWYSWTVTSAVEKALSNGTLTLILEENYGASCYFFSKDIEHYNEKRPKLNISYEPPNVPPTANFSCSKYNPAIHDTLQFTDMSIDSDGYISSWLWNFCDGTSSTTKNPQHKFNTTGTYNITLEVTDDYGAKNSSSITINVSQPNVSSNIPPTAFFSYFPFTAKIGDKIQFIDYSKDTDGLIFSYYWDFGDGNTSELKNPTKIFNKSGTYSVSLKVTDNNDETTTYTTSITVTASDYNDNPPIPLFIIIPIIFVLAFAMLMVAFFYLRERKRIKTKILEQELEKLREKEQAQNQEKLK